jgi:hypothetical protein
MADITEQPVRVERCCDCGEDTTRPVLVRCIEASSGPGWMLYACPGCAPRLLSPDAAWELCITHGVTCEACRTWPCDVLQTLLGVWRKTRRTLHAVSAATA